MKTRSVYVLEVKQTPEGWNFVGAYTSLRAAHAGASAWIPVDVPYRIARFVNARRLRDRK